MYPRSLIATLAFSALCLAGFAGCATAPAPPRASLAPPPGPAANRAITVPPAAQATEEQASRNEKDWNLFPDPMTGRVDVYYKGAYVGAVTGNEPAGENPPLPHPVPNQWPATIP